MNEAVDSKEKSILTNVFSIDFLSLFFLLKEKSEPLSFPLIRQNGMRAKRKKISERNLPSLRFHSRGVSPSSGTQVFLSSCFLSLPGLLFLLPFLSLALSVLPSQACAVLCFFPFRFSTTERVSPLLLLNFSFSLGSTRPRLLMLLLLLVECIYTPVSFSFPFFDDVSSIGREGASLSFQDSELEDSLFLSYFLVYSRELSPCLLFLSSVPCSRVRRLSESRREKKERLI